MQPSVVTVRHSTQPFEEHRFLGRVNLHAGTPPSQFLIYNHVSDYYYYGEAGHTFLTIRDTLETYLLDLGFEIIVFFNTSEGRKFARPGMAAQYNELTSGTPQKRRYSDARRGQEQNPPQEGSEETERAAIDGLSNLLRQESMPPDKRVRTAVIIERVQNIVSSQTSDDMRRILDAIQSWSSLRNDNVSFLIADVARLESLPASLTGAHRSGVALINVGLPNHKEINQLFISAEQGTLAQDFQDSSEEALPIPVNGQQRRELIGLLSGTDVLTIRGYFNECVRRGVQELNIRSLRSITTHSRDVWPELLTEYRLQQVEMLLNAKVRGQAFAIDSVLGRLRAARHDLMYQVNTGQISESILAYFFFAGPTGVGKTEVFRVLDEAFPEIPTRKFNMPEYREEHSVARFFGAPPGYVGHGRGELGEFLIDNPASIILFDEFEKAHPNVWRNFLTMLEGSLTTGDGIRVDLSQTIFIFTSNAGATELESTQRGLSDTEEIIRNRNRDTVQRALRTAGAPPELIGRLLESIIPFNHMTEPVIKEIIALNLDRLAAQFGHAFCFDESVHTYIFNAYHSEGKLGARMLRQHIEGRLKADILQLQVDGAFGYTGNTGDVQGVVYKDQHRQTRYVSAAEKIETRYQSETDRHTSATPTRIDASTADTLRETSGSAVVAVITRDAQGDVLRQATGFFVTGSGHVVANHWALEQAASIEIVHGERADRMAMTVMAYSTYFGVAVLRPTHPLQDTPLFLPLSNSATVESGTDVSVVGYTTNMPAPKLEIREHGYIESRYDTGYLFELAEIEIPVSFAGSPLFNREDGALIGVILSRREGRRRQSLALMSSALQNMLVDLGIVEAMTTMKKYDRYGIE